MRYAAGSGWQFSTNPVYYNEIWAAGYNTVAGNYQLGGGYVFTGITIPQGEQLHRHICQLMIGNLMVQPYNLLFRGRKHLTLVHSRQWQTLIPDLELMGGQVN